MMRQIPRVVVHTTLALSIAAAGAVTAAPAFAADPVPAHRAGGALPSTAKVAAGRTGATALDAVPASVSLRASMPPVGDQGQISSCVAWSIGYSLMGYYANLTSAAGAPYAPLYLYMRTVDPGGAPDDGLYPPDALARATAAGVDTQADYTQGTTGWRTPPSAAQVANATNYKVAGWTTLWSGYGHGQGTAAQASIKQALAAGSPVAIDFPVFPDFFNIHSSALYTTTSGANQGGHMVAAYGYDNDGIWIRNSWGTGWGAAGDAHISWAFVQADVWDAYTISGLQAATKTAPPTITALSTTSGSTSGGTEVTISGTNLRDATAVRFGTSVATFHAAQTAGGVTQLVATSPAHAGEAVTVTVTSASGTSAAGPAATFTYKAPAPLVTGLSLASVSTLGGSTVTVTGANLTGVTAVKAGALAGTGLKVLSPTTLSFVTPAATAGTVHVTVSGPTGSSTAGDADLLTFVKPPVPALTSLSPASAATTAVTSVTVTGTNLGDVTRVTAGGASVAFTKVSNTQLRLTLPPHAAGPVDVVATSAAGASPAARFTYLAPVPAISALSPATGPTNGATLVTLTGTKLGDATRVTASGSSIPFTRVSDTKLFVVLPAHAAGTVTIEVTTPGGSTASSTATRFNYVAAPGRR
jgi:IPT/TIG domain/Papain family cysteine protease